MTASILPRGPSLNPTAATTRPELPAANMQRQSARVILLAFISPPEDWGLFRNLYEILILHLAIFMPLLHISYIAYIACKGANMTQPGPAVRKAMEHILSRIESGEYASGCRIPSVKLLAVDAGVSESSMWKAANLLRSKGILDAVAGRGFSVLESAPRQCRTLMRTLTPAQPAVHNAGQLAWERIRQRIEQDICNGVFESGKALPPIKELCRLYGSSYRTVRKSLLALAGAGTLLPGGAGFTVPALRATQASGRIVFLGFAGIDRQLRFEALNEDFFRFLESECSTSKIGLTPVGYFTEATTDPPQWYFADSRGELCELADNESILGFLHLVARYDKGCEFALRALSHVKKPIAVLDVTGGWELPWYLGKPDVRLFSAAVSAAPGRHVGEYLIAGGHRHLAYISPFHQALWSQNRLHGLGQALAAAGGSVDTFTLDMPAAIPYYYREEGQSKSDFESLLACYRKWRVHLGSEYRAITDPLFEHTLPVTLLSKAAFRTRLTSLFDRALSNKAISAWVCANDEVALAALHYLREKDVAVPDTISVAGFDDTAEALRQGLTSYNFNMRAMVHRMLGFLLNTRSAPRQQRPIEVDGMIIERRSTEAT
ncbi:MAG: GntR family transcriptional regulator [Chitinivibrionales bacterium]|nr:GntR family transcriptional regulator [Chitinivibrionales bacterium]